MASNVQNRPGVPASPICELCEENLASHLCEDCNEKMCGVCKKAHEKSKVSREHNIVSLSVISMKTKKILKRKSEQIFHTMSEFDAVIRECKIGLEQTDDSQRTALRSCVELRKTCHDDVDKYFDTLKEDIEEFIEKIARDIKRKMSKARHEFDQLRRCYSEIMQMTECDDAMLGMDGGAYFDQVDSYIGSVKIPVVKFEVARITIERGRKWKACHAASLQLHTTHRAAETHRSTSVEV